MKRYTVNCGYMGEEVMERKDGEFYLAEEVDAGFANQQKIIKEIWEMFLDVVEIYKKYILKNGKEKKRIDQCNELIYLVKMKLDIWEKVRGNEKETSLR